MKYPFAVSIKISAIFLLILIINSGCKKENANKNYSFNENQFLNKKYDEVCFLTTHNAMNSKEREFTAPNQTFSVTNQ